MKLLFVKPFVVKDATKFPPRPWVAYLMSAVCTLTAMCALACWWLNRPSSDGGGSNLAGGFVFVFIALGFLGYLFVQVGQLDREATDSRAELTQRITEQDERIRKLEAQLAAFNTPNTTR